MNKELPEGWEWTTVVNSVDKISTSGKKLKQKDYLEEGNLPVVDQGQLEVGGYTNLENLRIRVDTPVIVFGDHTKVFKYINYDFVPGADGIKILKPLGFYNPKLFFYFLQFVNIPDKGYARHFQYLEKAFIPLPPLAEQQRIVNKIEELFTNLDKGIEYLKTAQAELRLTRQSVLKYALEGKLTEDWREKHKDEIEPASVLLEKIKAERKKEGKYKSVLPFDTSSLQNLPKGWVWTTVANSVDKISTSGKKIKQKDYLQEGSIPVIDQGQLEVGGYTNLEDLKISVDTPVIVFGDHTKIFKYIIYDFVPGADGIKILKPLDLYNPKLFYYLLNVTKLPNKGYARHFQFLEKATIPLPPLAEQHQIVEVIENYYSILDNMETTISQSLNQTSGIRQSILKKAFEGRLVPQDPNDEPASVLLEKIKADKSKSEKEKISEKRNRFIKEKYRQLRID